jgi:long-chain acyl-CoA synthetase
MKIENVIFKTLYEKSIFEPDNIAVRDENKSFTNQELYEHILKCRTALWARSYYRNDIIILKMKSCTDWIIQFLSLISIGCIVVPVSPKMTESELNKLTVKLDDKYERYYLLDEIVDYSRVEVTNKLDDLPENAFTAILHMTSGSTGVPKLCVRSHMNLYTEGVSYVHTLDLISDDIIVTPLPIYHSYTLGYACMGSIVAGATMILMDSYTPRKLLKCVEKQAATIALVVPSIIKELENLYLDREYDTSSLQCFMSGAGALNEESVNRVRDKYHVDVYSNYGSTETGALATGMSNRLPNSVGVPMHGVEIEIKDANGHILGSGEKGYVCIKSDASMSGYYADLTQVYDENGFFCMGDIGYLDEDNNLFIVGRTKLLINIGGKKVNPVEVEEVIFTIDGVKEVFVHAGNRSNGTEVIVAELIASKEVTKELVKSYCKIYLSDYKIPDSILFQESIKKNEMGKYIIDREGGDNE